MIFENKQQCRMAFNALRLLLPGGEDGESSEEEALLDHEGGSSSEQEEDSGEEEGESNQPMIPCHCTPSVRDIASRGAET